LWIAAAMFVPLTEVSFAAVDSASHNLATESPLVLTTSTTYSGAISGSGIVRLDGGSAILSGNNTYSGTTEIAAGTLTIGTSTMTGSLGSSSVTDNGTLRFNRGDTAIYTISNSISGTGGLLQSSGKILLSGANTYSGTTYVNLGTLKGGAANVFGGVESRSALQLGALGVLNLGGYDQAFGSLTGANGIITSDTAGPVTLTVGYNETSPAAYTGRILNGSGTVGLTKVGSGKLSLSGTCSYTGPTVVNDGTLSYLSVNAIAGGDYTVSKGMMDTSTFSRTVGAVTLSNGGVINGSGVLTGASYNMQDGTVNLILGGGAGVALTKSTAGTVTLANANTYGGPTVVSEGILRYGVSDAIADGAVTVSGGTLDIGGLSDTVGAVTLDSGNIIGSGGGTLTGVSYDVRSGLVSAVLGGATASLTKTTGGDVTLAGANTYGGGTFVEDGRLIVNGSITGITTVEPGGILSGNGIIGNITLNAGGVLSPGNSPGKLTSLGETWEGGGIYEWEINDLLGGEGLDPGWDFLDIDGDVTLLNVTELNPFNIEIVSLTGGNVEGVPENFDPLSPFTRKIADISGGTGWFDESLFHLDFSRFSGAPDSSFTLSANGTALNLTYSPPSAGDEVPEPSTLLLLLPLLAGGFALKNLRRCRAGK